MRDLYWLTVLTFLFSCSFEKYDGYEKETEGIYKRLHAFSEGGRIPSDSDFVTYHFALSLAGGESIFSSYARFPAGITERSTAAGDGRIELFRLFHMMAEGDSASFILEGNALLSDEELMRQAAGGPLKADIRILKVRSPKEFADEMRRLKEFGEAEERVMIDRYLKENNLPPDTSGRGICFLDLKPGEGRPAGGMTVRIKYKGSLLSGAAFDQGEISFTWGDEMQVLPGIERALSSMGRGALAKIIIPSYLAYGEKGSSNGTVPPFTPLIYELEVLELK